MKSIAFLRRFFKMMWGVNKLTILVFFIKLHKLLVQPGKELVNMKNLILLTSLMNMMTCSLVLAQGVGAGGGGYAIVCRDPSTHQITKATLLDIAEGQTSVKDGGYGCKLQDSNDVDLRQDEKDQRVEEILKKSYGLLTTKEPLSATFIEQKIKDLRDPEQHHLIFEPTRTVLVPPEDYGNIHLYTYDEGCNAEPLGHYAKDGSLHINQNIFDKLSSTGQAGFWRHEAIYAFERNQLQRSTSESSRALNVKYLSDEPSSCSFNDSGIDPENDLLSIKNHQIRDTHIEMKYSCDLSQLPPFYVESISGNNEYFLDTLTFNLKTFVVDQKMRYIDFGDHFPDFFGRFDGSVNVHQLQNGKIVKIDHFNYIYNEHGGYRYLKKFDEKVLISIDSLNAQNILMNMPILFEPEGTVYFKSGSIDQETGIVTLNPTLGKPVTCNPLGIQTY